MDKKATTDEAVRLLPITYYGDPQLEKPSTALTEVDESTRELAVEMLATMYENNGIGLAGPQVGKNVRIVVIDIQPGEDGLPPTASPGERLLTPKMPLVLINPEVTPITAATAVSEEGCLSFPNIYGDVERPVEVMLKSRILGDTDVQVACGGLLGRCLQHEIDHLNGVVFVDRMEVDSRREIEGELKKLRKRTRKGLKRRS